MRPERTTHINDSGNISPAVNGRQRGPVGIVPRLHHEARQQYLAGNIGEALRILDKVFAPDGSWAGRGIQPSAGMREAALLRAWCLIEAKEHQACRRWLDTARSRGCLDPDDRGAAVLELNISLFEENYVLVQDRAEELLAASKDQPGLEQAELRLLLGAALRWQGFAAEAVGHVEYACLAFGFLQEPGREAVAANFLGWTHLTMGKFTEARRWFEKSLQINSGLGAGLRLAQNYQNLAIVCYKQGHYRQAIDLLEKELGLVSERPDMMCRARIALGNVKRLQGDCLAARGSLLEAYSLAAEAGLAREEALALEYLGDVFRDEGHPDEAMRYYQRGLKVAHRLAPRGDLVMELLRREGECLDLGGRHEEALHVLNDSLQLCREVGDRFETAVTLRCLGVNAANLGRWKQATDHLRSALEGLAALGARHEAMLTRRHLARVLMRQIDTGNAGARAARLLDEAWQQALAAQQAHAELGRTALPKEDVDELVNELARRKFTGQEETRRPGPFSTRHAPCSRVIATSAAMQEVLRRCDGFARYDNPVLITGESGVGKELLARRVHEISARGSKPFIKVACSASSPSVLAREIFGQLASRNGQPEFLPGLLAQAEGGTLLLAGIEDLPRHLQDKLMNLFQDSVYRAEGDSRDRRCNVRIIATAREDLGGLVAQGRFRANLHFRLRLMSVPVPPLRERTEDLIPLLEHFLARLEGSSLRARSLFDFQALEAMAMHRWPGNAAEVEAVAQQAWMNRNLGRPVMLRRVEGPLHATLEFTDNADQTRAASPVGEQLNRPTHPSGMTWSALMALIERADGNKSKVARHLGISRITLYRWLEQLEPEK
jgi:DNA-binding NtrC family response regulator/tetratricopeptide (TPR) repeat protein